MDMLCQQMIIEIKSRFFDLFVKESKSMDYNVVQKEMLSIIQHVLQALEVTLYSSKERADKWTIEASTISSPIYSIDSPFINNKKEYRTNTIMSSLEIEKIDNNKIILPIKIDEDISHLLVIKMKEKIQDQDSSMNELWKSLCVECSSFLYKVQNLLNIVMEEKRYKQLFRVTEKFHSSMKMEGVLGEIIYTLKEVFPTFHYYLLLSHDNNSHGDLPIKDLEYDSENIAAMEAYVTGEIQLEVLRDDRISLLYAPLKGKQGVYGVLQVIAPNALYFPRSEVEFITLLANTAGSALENAQLYQQSKRLVADLQLINEVSHRLNSNLRLNEMMNYMCKRIRSSFAAEEVGFILFSSESPKVTVLKGSTSFFQTEQAQAYIQYFKEKIKIEKDALFLGDFSMQSINTRYKSIMVVPMMQTGSLKGFAIVMHPAAYHFSFDTFKLLQSLIHHSTLALTNSMLREELEKMVVTDHLTKLFSRNYLDEKINRSLNEDKEGTFILIDIDNFKAVNDTYGHQVGDEIIIQVANIIIENIRGSDIGSRWGGEELAIYLPKVSLDVGINIAERLVKKVREISSPSVTISCGVSYWNQDEEDNYNSIFKRADKALYIAKKTGKDRVIVQDTFLVSE